MKLKKILTIFIFSLMAFTGVFFGCKDKYKDFSIQVNGESEIKLRAGNFATDEEPNSREIEILIKNAPNNNCRIISYSVSQNNIVSIEELTSSSKDIKRFKITALDNISAFDPSTVITFKSLEGNKSCELKINVEIPISGLSQNLDYTPYVVSDSNPYYIDASNAFNYFPKNTTEREVEFSLENEIDGVSLSKSGEIRVNEEEYFKNEDVSSKIKVRATSKKRSEYYVDFYVSVLRDIKFDNLILSYKLNGEEYKFSGDTDTEAIKSIGALMQEGITLASNLEEMKNSSFAVGVKSDFGLNFNEIEVKFERMTLLNVLIETNLKDNTDNLKNFNIYSTNPGVDTIVVYVKYKNVDNYSKTIQIPVKVLEYPISLIVNNSVSNSYDIFDYYKDNSKGQEFNVNISQTGAYDNSFKIYISEEDFNLVEIRYQDEVLGYNELTTRVFENNSSLFVLAKESQNDEKSVKIKFYSNILSGQDLDLIVDDFYLNLIKEINLNLVPGVRSLGFGDGVKEKNYFYLEKSNCEFEVPFTVNNAAIKSLNRFVNIEFIEGAELVDVSRDIESGKFILKSKGQVGDVEFYLKSDNGVETSQKSLFVYAGYDETSIDKFELDLNSNNIKKVAKENNGQIEYDYYLGTTYGKNSANFKIVNHQKSSIYKVEVNSSNEAIKVTILDKNELFFNLSCLANVEESVKITISIWVYNTFDKVNETVEKQIEDIEFNINTYVPLTGVTFTNGEISSEVTIVDGEGLDLDSLENKLNMLDLNKLVKIEGVTEGNKGNIKVKFNFPSELKEATYDSEHNVANQNDFHQELSDGELFNKIYFHVYKNHQNKFIDGKFIFGLTIEIYDLAGSDEAYLLTLKVVLTEQVKSEKVEIKNDGGFVYLSNQGVGFAQIEAEVIGENYNEATNKSLEFKIIEGTSVTVDKDTGVVSFTSAGVTKVRVYAKGSKYTTGGEYSIFSDVYVVVADGSMSFPYILENVQNLNENRYYTLNKDVEFNQSITKQVAGIDGKFSYAKYSNSSFSENSVYSLIFSGTGSVFNINNNDALTAKLTNLNIIYNQNKVEVSDDFGIIAKENNGEIKNLNLILNNLQIINNNLVNVVNIGLLFAQNNGLIENCFISSIDADYTNVILEKASVNFGGFVAQNMENGSIISNFNFLKNINHGMAKLRIVDLSNVHSESCVAGVVAKNQGVLNGIKIDANITSNAKYVGGIAGKIESKNKEYKNLYFSGNIMARNSDAVVGGISAYVKSEIEDANKFDFTLIFVEFVGNILENSSSLSGHTVGGLFGSVNFEGANQTNIKYAYVQNFSKLYSGACNIEGLVVGGLIGTNATSTKLSVVFSDVVLKAKGNIQANDFKGGAFIGNMNANLSVDNAYSYVTGVQSFVGNILAGNLKFNKVYSTTCVQEHLSTDSKYFYDKTNYVNVITVKDENGVLVFNDNKYFAYVSTKNGGKPYLVYNETDGFKKLMTIVATSIDAKLQVKNDVENSNNKYVYGNGENVVVIKDDELNKGVIYFKNNLVYDVDEIFNISSTPSDAVNDFELVSLNNNVVSIVNGKLKIVGIGNATIEIYAKHNTSVKTYVYLSVIERVDTFDIEKSITISKGSTKQIDTKFSPKTESNGLYFVLNDDVSSKLLINNKEAINNEIYHLDARTIFTGLDQISQTTIDVMPYSIVRFGDESYNFIDFENKKSITIKVVNSASIITTSVNYFAIPENETIEFEVYVDSTGDILNQNLIFERYGEYLVNYFEIDASKKTIEGSLTKFNVKVTAKDVSLSEDRAFEFVIRHKIGDELNQNVSAKINVLLKSSKLQNVELNHFSSTITYYNAYDYVINKETIPSYEITKGNLGVLSINLYPSFANITDIDVTSSIVNGNRINFSQLKLNEENKLTVTSAKDTLPQGIKLNVNKQELQENGGNIYVGTLLSTDILDDTIFTITVTCYYGLGHKYQPVTLNLKAKALTTIILTNPNGSDENFVPKGGEIALNINTINMDEDFEGVSTGNFKFSVNGNELIDIYYNNVLFEDINGFRYVIEPESKTIFGYKINENNQLVIYSDILNKRNTKLKITPTYSAKVNGKDTISEGATIEVCVVDYFVNGVKVSDCEDGILKNYLGSSTMLKAELEVNGCKNYIYFDANGSSVDKFEYIDENGLKQNISVSNLSERELEFSNINLKIQTLTELISKSNYSWNLITQNSNGNLVYNNIKENTSYSNFVVTINSDGYYIVTGKNISENRMLIKVNIGYDDGLVALKQGSNNEVSSEFVLDVKTESSLDNPVPIKTVDEFVKMSDNGNYILLNDLTLPTDFGGINAKISSFDGNNKTINIQGFSISSTSQTSVGLFNEISENSIVKNLKVNVLPTLYYANNEYNYGLNINAQTLASLNFGVLCGTNKGVITNCHVVNTNYKLINNKNAYENIEIFVNVNESIEANVGGFVGVNDGYITYSSMNDKNSSNQFTITAKAQMAGFVAINNKKIASSYVVNTTIYNNSLSKNTAGFVAVNAQDASVTSSYVQGYSKEPLKVLGNSITEGGIFANGYVGGFVTTNSGNIKDCYSNILINTNKRSSGFVYDNTNGYVETSISASSASKSTQSFRYFTGNNEENLTLNNDGVKYCYYWLEGQDVNGEEGEYGEPANGIMSLDDASYFEGFISDGTSSSVWSFNKGMMPRLVDADQDIVCERKLINENSQSNQTKYEYVYINNSIGSINNPIIVSTTEQFFNALTSEENLYSYYFNGKINKTKINYKHISIVKDLDLSKIIDINNGETNTTTQVQKLQDIIFAGSLNANNMLLENITIAAKNDKLKYTSFGLFKQIGVELAYDNNGNIKNDKLDEDNCTVVKNINFEIDGISATITKSVGTLSGEVINSKLYNISIISNRDVVVTGNNIVGGVAGRISGNSFVKGVSSNLGVKATFDNKSSNYDYSYQSTKKIYKYPYDAIIDDENYNVNIVGGLFGVVDIYKTRIENFVQNVSSQSYYVNAVIEREQEVSFENSSIQFTKVGGDIQISGDIVGGMFGLVLEGSSIYDARFVLNESNTQNLIANYAVGGIAGVNKGLISYAIVETELNRQRVIDKTSQNEYLTSYLFSNSNNKAYFVGGLVGILDEGILNYSYNKANIDAKSSRFVGSSVGAFINSRIEFVYANSYLACQEEVNNAGLITTQKGYAGFIGTIIEFNDKSSITNFVSLLRNTQTPSKFGLASFVGYNQAKNISENKIIGECLSNVSTIFNGIDISVGRIDNSKSYNDFISQVSGTFNGYAESSCFTRTVNLDTFYRLTYNKKGSVRSITSEDDLRNMLSKGVCVLEKDIYLENPWDPLGNFEGKFYSAKRQNRKEGQSEYYIIYNLTINNQSKNVSGNVGFFASTNNAEISNITFVVGSNYTDPAKRGEEFVNTDPTEEDIDENWGNGAKRGINIINQNVEAKYGLGVLSAVDNNSVITNINIKFSDNNGIDNKSIITTNLNYVGGLIGKANGTTIGSLNEGLPGVTFENLNMKREEAKNFDTYFGGLIGLAKDIKCYNVNLNGSNKIYNLQGKENQYSYVGGLFGQIQNSVVSNCTKKALEITHNADGIGGTESNIYIGGIAGSSNGLKLNSVNLSDAIVSVENNYSNLKSLYVGGLIGESKNSTIQNAVLSKTCQVLANDKTQTSNSSNFIGGVCGYSEGGNILQIMNSASVELEAISSSGISRVGGVVGSNGLNEKGSVISNIICTSSISVKDKGKKDVNVGGLLGYNYCGGESNVNNSLFVGMIKYYCQSLDYIGGLIGNDYNSNTSTTPINYENCYFIEDVSLTPSRNTEFGAHNSDNTFAGAVKFSDFVNGYIGIVKEIINKNEFYKQKLENNELKDPDIDSIEGEDIYFHEGSVYNPISVSSLISFEDNKYYLIKNDLNFTETISEIKGDIIGDGHKFVVKKTFAESISKNAIVSGLTFELSSDNTSSFNGNVFVNNVQTIVAEDNYGVIYNCAVKGNIYANDVAASPVVLNNAGVINVVTSLSHLVAKGLTQDDAYVSGFVNNNSGAIYNSISTGNIEFIEAGEIKNYNVGTKYNEDIRKIFGFVKSNLDTMANCVSAITLPLSDKYYESFGYDKTTSKFANCFIDIAANGNYYDYSIPNGVYYYSFDEIFSKEKDFSIRKNNATSNMWSENLPEILFGYAYPSIATYKTNDFAKNLLTTKTNEEKYLINNLSSLNFVVNTLNEEETITDIKIKQIASFMGAVNRKTQNATDEIALKAKNLKIKKSLNFDGSDFVIYNLLMTSEIDKEKSESVVGLFSCDEANKNIVIANLALISAKFEVLISDVSDENDKYNAVKDVYAGALVAKNNGNVSITSCYVDGQMISSNEIMNVTNYSNAKNIYAGAFVGFANGTNTSNCKIENSINKLNVNLDYLVAKIVTSKEKQAYSVNVGGFAGKVSNMTLNNNYNFGDVSCSSAKEANIGGIVGFVDGGALTNNSVFGVVSYKGAYLGYYASADDDDLIYNIKAIAGKVYNITNNTGNKYNSSLSLVEDANNSESVLTDLTDLIGANITWNDFADNTKTATNIFEKPNFKIVTENSWAFEDDVIYIVDVTGEFTFAYETVQNEQGESVSKKNLTNTKILFVNETTTTISSNIFDTLTNCTISNLKIKASQTLHSAALANKIENTNLYNITLDEIYFNRTSETSSSKTSSDYCIGSIVDVAEVSILTNVKTLKGRVEAVFESDIDAKTLYVGGIVGLSKQTLFNNCENNSTVTTASTSSSFNNIYTAGISGKTEKGYLFKCSNFGLIYAKNAHKNNIGTYTAGIVNGENSNDIISFCKNESKIKGVNNYSGSSAINFVGGIANNGTILYCINKTTIMSISPSKSNSVVAAAISAGNATSVYYSYQLGGVMSSSQAYTITSGTASYCYTLGGGYTTLAPDRIPDISPNASNNKCFGLDEILETTSNSDKEQWWEYFAGKTDESGNVVIEKLSDFVVSTDNNFTQPRIKLIDLDAFTLKTDSSAYLISTSFELWYWSMYADKTTKDVKLVDDIDMTGYTYITPSTEFSRTFDGGYHTISNLTIKGIELNLGTEEDPKYATVWGFVSQNSGTIQNINFENPSIKITDFGGSCKKYVSVVAGQNSGTIQDVLVSSTEQGLSFIDIDVSITQNISENIDLNSGVMSAENSGHITSCEVINFDQPAIESSVVIDVEFMLANFNGNGIYTHIGGISGINTVTGIIENSYFYSSINSTAKTNGMRGVGAGDEVGADIVGITFYSEAQQYVGAIVGSNEGTVSSCYAPKLDSTLYVKTENLFKSEETGVSIEQVGMIAGRVSTTLLVDSLIAAKVIKKYGKKTVEALKYLKNAIPKLKKIYGAAKAASKLKIAKTFGKLLKGAVKPSVILTIISLTIEISKEAQRVNSFKHEVNTIGLTDSDSILIPDSDSLELLDKKSEILSPYTSENAVDTSKQKYIPAKIAFNKKFVLLSNLQVEPKQENEKYYVYNVNELAYALSHNIVKNIVLMDNISMAGKVWDSLLTVSSGLTITDNGFKIVYGSNENFENDYTDTEKGYKNILVKKEGDANEYGRFETVSRNLTKVAYENFKERFRKVWEEEYIKEYPDKFGEDKSENDKNLTLDNAYAALGNDDDTFVVQYARQLEVVADAMTTYRYNGSTHQGINFYGKTIIINKDLDVSSINIDSLDIYDYEDYNENQIMYVCDDRLVTESELITILSTNENAVYYPAYKVPDFVKSENDNVDYISEVTKSGARKAFMGTIEGNNKTIKLGNSCKYLFLQLGETATVKNLTIDATYFQVVNDGGVSLFSFGVLANCGKIENIKLITQENISINQEVDFAENLIDKPEGGYPSTLEATTTSSDNVNLGSNLTFGLFSALNFGEISGCEIDNDLTITSNITLDHSYGTTSVYLRDKDGELVQKDDGSYSITQININSDKLKVQTDESITQEIDPNPYKGKPRETTINLEMGVICGLNHGKIENINLSGRTININAKATNTCYDLTNIEGVDERDQQKTGENIFNTKGINSTINLSSSIGLISGSNEYFAGSTESTEESTDKITNIQIANCQLNVFENLSGCFGLVSGYSELGFDGCSVLGCSISNSLETPDGDKSNTSEIKVTKGSLTGRISPCVYSVKKSTEHNNILKYVELHTAHIPQITNCFATGYALCGEEKEIIIGKKEKAVDVLNDEDKTVTAQFSEIIVGTYEENGGTKNIVSGLCEFFFNDIDNASLTYDDTAKRAVATNHNNNNTNEITIKVGRCSELYERYISGYNGTRVNVSYDDCNPFGMIAGDFGEITSLSKHTSQSASESTIVAFNFLSELFATFMGNFEISTNGTEYIPTVSGNALNSYTQFYNKAIELYNSSLVSFTKNVNNDLTRSAVIGVNHPYTMAFGGDISPELIDFQTVIANLFGFSSKTEFMNYAQDLADTYAQHRTNITNSLTTNEALENGCFYTSNGSFVFPIAVKNELASTVLAYVILDTSGLVSVWVNDITAALWATNFNSSYHTDSIINNELYCKNILFVTGSTKSTKARAYLEHNVKVNDTDTYKVIPDVSFDGMIDVRLKVTLKSNDSMICYLADGQDMYVSNGKLVDFVTFDLVKVAEDGFEGIGSTYSTNKEITINGEKFIASVEYGSVETVLDGGCGFKLKILYTGLKVKTPLIEGKSLSEVSGYLKDGMSFVEPLDTVVDLNNAYHVNYEFTKGGTTYTFNNIEIIPTDLNGNLYQQSNN